MLKDVKGRASKGRPSYYHYNQRSSSCGYMQKADATNDVFLELLRGFVLNPALAALFKQAVLEVYQAEAGNRVIICLKNGGKQHISCVKMEITIAL
jgi:hypothetical protein